MRVDVDTGGEKRNVLIVAYSRQFCAAQQDAKAHLMRQQTFLIHVATAPKAVVGHGQVEDQAARCVLELVADLHVAAPLACACRYAVLRADRVSGRAEQRP